MVFDIKKVGSGEWSEQHYNGGDSEDDGEWETIEAQHLVGQDTPMKIDDGPGPNQNTAHEVGVSSLLTIVIKGNSIVKHEVDCGWMMLKGGFVENCSENIFSINSKVVFDLSYPSMSSNLVNGAVTKQSQASFSRPVHWDETHDRPSSSGLVKFLCCLLGNEEFRAHLGRGAKGPNSISKIDKVSRVLFPFAFLAFNVIYWSIYYFDHNGVKDWEDTD